MNLRVFPADARSRWMPLLKGMHLHPLTLRFTGPLEHLETRFQKDYLAQSVNQIRVSIVLGAILYALFGILDLLLIPEKNI